MATVVPDCYWTEMNCIKLIREFRKNPMLWDPRDPYFYKKNIKPYTWEEISQKLDIPAEECKRKMVILMSSFRREKAKIMQSLKKGGEKDSSQVFVSTWFAFQEMAFLMDKERERKRQSSGIDTDSEDAPIPIKKITLSHNTIPVNSTSRKSSFISSAKKHIGEVVAPEIPKSSRKEIEPSPGPSANVSDADEEIKSFANFISFKMRKYSEATKNAVQQAICEIIFKADQNYFENTKSKRPDDPLEKALEYEIEEDCMRIKVESDVEYYSENSDTLHE